MHLLKSYYESIRFLAKLSLTHRFYFETNHKKVNIGSLPFKTKNVLQKSDNFQFAPEAPKSEDLPMAANSNVLVCSKPNNKRRKVNISLSIVFNFINDNYRFKMNDCMKAGIQLVEICEKFVQEFVQVMTQK